MNSFEPRFPANALLNIRRKCKTPAPGPAPEPQGGSHMAENDMQVGLPSLMGVCPPDRMFTITLNLNFDLNTLLLVGMVLLCVRGFRTSNP